MDFCGGLPSGGFFIIAFSIYIFYNNMNFRTPSAILPTRFGLRIRVLERAGFCALCREFKTAWLPE
jgi:hypothetical protein